MTLETMDYGTTDPMATPLDAMLAIGDIFDSKVGEGKPFVLVNFSHSVVYDNRGGFVGTYMIAYKSKPVSGPERC